MFRTIYQIEVIHKGNAELTARRFAANKRTAEEIVKSYDEDKEEVTVRRLQLEEKDWVDPDDVEDICWANKNVKAVIINFGDDRGDIIVTNDNFGSRRRYTSFVEGKQKAGLDPHQIVYSGKEPAHICKDRYIGADDQIHTF